MTNVSVLRGGDWTVDDLDRLPDDGLQYELVDGVLLVSPAAVPLHQRVVKRLAILLDGACPPDLEVYIAPLDFQPTPRRSLQPDVLVVRRRDIGPRNLQQPPVLAVEVLSPTTRSKDLVLKRAVYAESGVPSFWVVDPDVPEVTAFTRCEGAYVEAGAGALDRALQVSDPFPVRVVPSLLVAD